MAKTRNTTTEEVLNQDVQDQNVTSQVQDSQEEEEIIDDEYTDEDEEFIDDDEDEEDLDTEPSCPTPPKPKELTPFQKVIKAFLEKESDTAAELKAKICLEDTAIVLCDKWITDYVKEQFKGQNCGFIDDNTGYTMMKEFFLDGVYENKLEEEKERQIQIEESRKVAEIKRQKAEEKKRIEEEEKRRKEEEEKRWKEFLERPEEVAKTMSEDELMVMRAKHATQGEFEF